MQWEEPSGLGHELLLGWAPWQREDVEGGASWSVKARLDKVHDGEPPEEVMLVDRIVARMKIEHRPYWRVISRIYLGEQPPWMIAIELKATQGWVRTMQLAACGLVEMRYLEVAPAVAIR